MKPIRRLRSLVLVLPLLLAFALPVTFTGCASPGDTQQEKAIRTHKDVWTVTHAAYQAWCERVVENKVTPTREALADAAWNRFRTAYKQSLLALRGDENAPPPAELRTMSTDLIAVFRTP